MAPKGDFENRDRDEAGSTAGIPLAGSLPSRLGELSEDLSNERGDLDSYSLKRFGSQLPDIVSGENSRRSAHDTGIGVPAADYSVRSVYDVRPPSAKDANVGFQTFGNLGCGSDDFAGFAGMFYVPRGYVAVIRGAVVYLPPTSIITTVDGTLQFMINGTAADPETVEAGPAIGVSVPFQSAGIPFRDGAEIDTYLVADEGSLIGTRLTFTTAPVGVVHVRVITNMLLKTGVPAMFQPANLADSKHFAVTASAKDIAGPPGPSGAELVRVRRRRSPFANVPILKK